MLILSAKRNQERIVVDDRVEISVLRIGKNRVWLAIHGVEGSTIDRLSVAKSKRDYDSPFDELFERLEEEPEERRERSGKSGAATLREHKERRRLDVERELGEISAKLERAEPSGGADEPGGLAVPNFID